LDKGYIHFADSGFVPLWKLCAARGLSVIADVHTHPGQWTDLSGSDREHPMIAQGGHIALIVPSYAAMNSLGTNGVGAHLYLGSGEWESMEPSNLIHLKWL
jgi:proteasome lid subunit RPN8/RPN11